MKWKKPTSLIMLVVGIGLCALAGFDLLFYGLEREWSRALVVFFSWGFIGIGLTLIGLALLIQSKLEQV